MVAEAGLITMWSSWLPAVTWSEAVPVFPLFVPVTVCGPATVAVQAVPAQEPSGAMVNVVAAVMSPSELSYRSRPSAVYVCDPPAAMLAGVGESARWSRSPARTLSDAVPVFPLFVPVTVCAPATVAVHEAPLHEPFGETVNVVVDVTSPSELS